MSYAAAHQGLIFAVIIYPGMFRSLRSRLILLVLLAILPGIGLVLVIASEQRANAIEQVKRTNLSILRLVQANQSQLISSAQYLLITLSQDSAVTNLNGNPESCKQVLQNVLQRAPTFRGFAAIKPDGEIWCSAPSAEPGRNVADTEIFKRTLDKKNFVIGGYQLGTVTSKGVLTFGYPLLDSSGNVRLVLYAGISTDWMNQQVAQLQLPDNYVVDVIDRDGTFLDAVPHLMSMLEPRRQTSRLQKRSCRWGVMALRTAPRWKA